MGVPHLTFNFSLGSQGGYGVDHHHVDTTRTDQHVGNFERLLTGIRLRDQQFIQIDANLLRVTGVEGMLGINKCGHATQPLCLRDDLQGERRFTRRFRTVDLDNAATRKPAAAQSNIKRQGSSRDDIQVTGCGGIAHPHHRTFAELLFNLGKGGA